MIPEEAAVWQSLKEAGYRYISFCDPTDEMAPTVFDVTPVVTLYATYKQYARQHQEPDIDELTIQQFGVAFNAVTEETLKKVRRRIAGKLVWGYAGVSGPGSHRTRLRSGRPRLR